MAQKKSTPADEPPQTINFEAAKKAKGLADDAVQLALIASKAMIAAKSMGISTPLENFTLSPAQREILLDVPDLAKPIKAKLKNDKASLTIAEVAIMAMAVAGCSTEVEPDKQTAMLLVAKHLTDQLQAGIAAPAKTETRKAKKPKAKADPNTVFQFKITLIGSNPSIWRRIQVEDCTIDKLHEHIQTAMGWTNSHLHRFEIGEKQYADPMLMEEDMEEYGFVDSTQTKISRIVPTTGKKFKFSYEYDFGDCWEHEILFEGSPQKVPGKKYPICLEGDRACPPEDVGGIGGFYEFLEALADPNHERHDDFMAWGGDFDPEKFDAKQATKEMKKGLPDWR